MGDREHPAAQRAGIALEAVDARRHRDEHIAEEIVGIDAIDRPQVAVDRFGEQTVGGLCRPPFVHSLSMSQRKPRESASRRRGRRLALRLTRRTIGLLALAAVAVALIAGLRRVRAVVAFVGVTAAAVAVVLTLIVAAASVGALGSIRALIAAVLGSHERLATIRLRGRRGVAALVLLHEVAVVLVGAARAFGWIVDAVMARRDVDPDVVEYVVGDVLHGIGQSSRRGKADAPEEEPDHGRDRDRRARPAALEVAPTPDSRQRALASLVRHWRSAQ